MVAAGVDGSAARQDCALAVIEIYYYLVLINAALFLGVAAITYWRNRFHQAGVYGALALAATGVWLVGFAQIGKAHV